jgi:chorismate mutase/prephenate dehydratase
MRIGYLGPEGTWSHQAALSRFGDSVELVPYASFDHIFSAVERNEVNYGVIPLENSTHGSVVQAMDIFAHTHLRICAQVHQGVQHCLMANIPAKEIRTIYSHPQVLGQCSQWLQQNYPHAEQIPTASSTAAARMAVEKANEGAAALGSPLAARLHGLSVLVEQVQDIATNTTRFVVIGTQDTKPSGQDRTTICFTVPHKPGGLVDVLEHFRNHGINIFCLDSRPTRDTAWEYLFYIDVNGHETEEPLRSCLAELKAECPVFKVLGSYPEK